MKPAYLQRPSHKNSGRKERAASVSSNNNSFFPYHLKFARPPCWNCQTGKLQTTKLGVALSDVALLQIFLNTTRHSSEGKLRADTENSL
jgi:hypothetical protein